MAVVGSLVANLSMNTSGFSKGAKRATGIMEDLSSRAASLAAGIGASLVAGFGFHQMVSEAQTAIQASRKLEAVLAATGGTAGFTADEIKQMATNLQAVTNFEDDTTVAAAAMLASFRSIRGDVFKQALGAAQDLAAFTGQDLQSAVMVLGKALNDPISGVGKLGKVIGTLTQEQLANIKAMQESGNVAGAQGVILDALASRMGGLAKATADPLVQLQNALGNVAEEVGTALLPSMNSLAKSIIQNSSFIASLVKALVIGAAAFAAVKIATLAYAAATQVATVATTFLQGALNPALLIKVAAGFAGAAVVVAAMNQQMETVSHTALAASANFQAMGESAEVAVGAATAKTTTLAESISPLIDQLTVINNRFKESAGFARAQQFNQFLAVPLGDSLKSMLSFADQLTEGQKKANALHDALDKVRSVSDVLGESATNNITAELKKQIGLVTGVSKSISDARNELNLVTGATNPIEEAIRRAREAGALPEQLKQLRDVLTQLNVAKDAVDKSEAAKRAQDALMKEGKRLFEQTRTPAEKIAAEIAHARELFAAGAITGDTLQRVIDQSKGTQLPESTTPVGSVAGLNKGSAEAFSAIQAAIRGGSKDPQQQVAKNSDKLVNLNEKMAAALDTIAGKGGDGLDIAIEDI